MSKHDDLIAVTQDDREAAAPVAVLAEMRELIRSGRADYHAEPFARHRIAEREKIVAWLRNALNESDSTTNHALNQRICCDGHMCGCRGSTVGDYLAHVLASGIEAGAHDHD